MALLPPFLHPLPHTLPIDHPRCQNARFIHKGSLGSTHALWWPPHDTTSEPDVVVLFIAGNPGLADFYTSFLSELHCRYASSNSAVVAHAHLDHFPWIVNDAPRYSPTESLTVQVEASLEVLDAIRGFYPKRTRIVAIGHSIGSWITLQMLKARTDAISAAFLLFPTISNLGHTPNGRQLRPIFSPLSRRILSSLSLLLKYFPFQLLSSVFPSWPRRQLLVLRDFIGSPTSVTASLAMAYEEMRTVRDLDTKALKQFKDKLWFYYAEHDDWVGLEKQAVLRAFDASHPTQVIHGPSGVPHAFCINHSDLLAEQCHKWLTTLEGNSWSIIEQAI